jgi:hypothetical protein
MELTQTTINQLLMVLGQAKDISVVAVVAQVREVLKAPEAQVAVVKAAHTMVAVK